jgi:hypothetical protein
MAFIIESDVVIAFAEYNDVLQRDQRLFDSNEGLTEDVVEDALIRATQRILNKMSTSQWWRDYYRTRDSSISYSSVADIPSIDAGRILNRQSDFTELCVYTALADYILPQVADFGDETDSERAKMGYYQNRAESLFGELIIAGDWYDFDDDSTIGSNEKEPGYFNLRRVR